MNETPTLRYGLWNLALGKWVKDADSDTYPDSDWTADSYEQAAKEVPRIEQLAYLLPDNRHHRFEARLYAIPCPFCGSRKLRARGAESPHHQRIHCDDCFADWRIVYANVRAQDVQGSGILAR